MTGSTAAQSGSPTRPLHPRDDSELIRRAVNGCESSFADLIERHQERLFNFLLRRCGNPDHAEEITQAAFVRAWQYLSHYDSRWRFTTWLYTIARRLDIDEHQRNRRTFHLDSASRQAGEADDPARSSEQADDFASVWDLADRLLSPDQRAALWLRYADNMPPDQIAAALGRTSISVRVLLHRARRTLAQELNNADRRSERRLEEDPSVSAPLAGEST